jgi:hypothetical protein
MNKKLLFAYSLVLLGIIATGVISTKTAGFQDTKNLGGSDIWCAKTKTKYSMNPWDRFLVSLGDVVVVDGSRGNMTAYVQTYTIFRIPYKNYEFFCDGGSD